MSRKCLEDEYNENRKIQEAFSEEEAEVEFEEDEKNIDDNNIVENCELYNLTNLLKEYATTQALPLCQYLNVGLMYEFFT